MSSHIYGFLDMDFISIVNYILVTILIYSGGQFVYLNQERKRREELVLKERDEYYKTLSEQSLKMENEILDEHQELENKVEELEKKRTKLETNLIELCNKNGLQCNLKSVEKCNYNDILKLEQNLNEELSRLEPKNKELQSIRKKIEEFSDENRNDPYDINSLASLTEEIRQLDLENSKFECQLETIYSSLPPHKHTDLDPELVKFIDGHGDVITDFLVKAEETKLEADGLGRDFHDYVRELITTQSNYNSESNRLKGARKLVENELKKTKADFQDALTNFNDQRIEYMIRNCGNYLEELKEFNKISQDSVDRLVKHVEWKQLEIASAEEQRRFDEEERKRIHQEMLETDRIIQRLEDERLSANWDQDRSLYNQSFNMSSASMSDNILPPQTIDVPTIEEILGSTTSAEYVT